MKFKNYIYSISLMITDLLAIIAGFYISYYIRSFIVPTLFPVQAKGFFAVSHFYQFWTILPIYILVFMYEKIYTKRFPFWEEYVYIIRGLFFSTAILVFFVYFSRSERVSARTIILFMLIINTILIPMFRYIIKFILFRFNGLKNNTAIIGSLKNGKIVNNNLNEIWYLGYNILGYIKTSSIKDIPKSKLLGETNGLEKLIKKLNLSSIIIIEEDLSRKEINSIINKVEGLIPEIKIIPAGLSIKTLGVNPEFVNEIMMLNVSNKLAIPLNKIIKSIIDFILSFIISLAILPFFLLIAIIIKIDSRGPVFHIQHRIGYNGKLFKLLKFRSMYVNADKRLKDYINKNKTAAAEWKKYQKLKTSDPRLTPMGKLLRRFSIDEMPQIFNVLKGNMSIIGPRPYLPREKDVIGKFSSIIFRVKPGLGGLWQIRGRNKLTFKTRLELDEFYVRNWSFFLDFMILAKTIKVVITGEGAY